MNFLSCEWRKLAVVNYAVDPALLQKYIPHKTELDIQKDTCYISLIGFMFLVTKTMGIKIPYHVNFEEVNLRFYVRHQDNNKNWKRGVVFIKEIVPKQVLAFVARHLFNENYIAMPMKHQWTVFGNSLEVEYQWKYREWNSLRINAIENAKIIKADTDEEFILEHYWGYTKASDTKTSEYKVEHPTWHVYPVKDYNIDVDYGSLYGAEFDFLKNAKPASVFLAEGSDVKVKTKRTL